jgi:hypothetical protein
MADLRGAFIADDDRYNIKTHRFVFDLVLLDEMLCGIADPPAFMVTDGLLCFADSLVSSGLDLDKNQTGRRTGSIHENKIDLPIFAAEIACNESIALFFKEFFAATLSPPTKFPMVSQKSLPESRNP